MALQVWWAVFGVPLFIMAVAWVGLSSGWGKEVNRILMTIAMFFPTVAALIGCYPVKYVQLGGRVHSGNELVVYGFGFLFALVGAGLGFVVALKYRRWFSAVGLGVSLDVVLVRPDGVSRRLIGDKSHYYTHFLPEPCNLSEILFDTFASARIKKLFFRLFLAGSQALVPDKLCTSVA